MNNKQPKVEEGNKGVLVARTTEGSVNKMQITGILRNSNVLHISHLRSAKSFSCAVRRSRINLSYLTASKSSMSRYLYDIRRDRLSQPFYGSFIIRNQSTGCIIHGKTLNRAKCGKSDGFAFEEASEETLDSLCDALEQLLQDSPFLSDADVTLSSGVLTLKLGPLYGTYVINKQGPNRQIWFSSPVTGPKRYDYINDTWIYKHDGISLHLFLSRELSQIFNMPVDLTNCMYGGNQSV